MICRCRRAGGSYGIAGGWICALGLDGALAFLCGGCVDWCGAGKDGALRCNEVGFGFGCWELGVGDVVNCGDEVEFIF